MHDQLNRYVALCILVFQCIINFDSPQGVSAVQVPAYCICQSAGTYLHN